MYKLVLATLAFGGAVLGTIMAMQTQGETRAGIDPPPMPEWEKDLRARLDASEPEETVTLPVAAPVPRPDREARLSAGPRKTAARKGGDRVARRVERN